MSFTISIIFTLCDEDPRSLQIAAADVPSPDSRAGSMMSSAPNK